MAGSMVDSSLGDRGDLFLASIVRALLAASFNGMTAELAALEEEKRRVIADSAHELRTPVALIDALRELQLIDSGRLRLEKELLDPLELAEQAASRFRAAAEGKRVALALRPAPDAPSRVEADRLRLTEVLYNLLSNALRHAPEGGAIEIRLTGGASGGLRISVEDSGPGVPPGERERIFERFYRLDASRSTKGGGRGLGLAIAREIVAAHGGRLSCGESATLGGAALAFELPARGRGFSP